MPQSTTVSSRSLRSLRGNLHTLHNSGKVSKTFSEGRQNVGDMRWPGRIGVREEVHAYYQIVIDAIRFMSWSERQDQAYACASHSEFFRLLLTQQNSLELSTQQVLLKVSYNCYMTGNVLYTMLVITLKGIKTW